MNMNKRTFLKLSSALLAAPVVSPLLAWLSPDEASAENVSGDKLKNWAGNLEYSTENCTRRPRWSRCAITSRSTNKMKVLGTRHCFNNIADSKDDFLSLKPWTKCLPWIRKPAP